MKILVVDDEPLIANYIVTMIRQALSDHEILGYVTSGEKALDSLSKQFVDLVFADITMPRMDGLQLLSEIKKSYPFTEVVMLTSHESFDYARISMQNQAFDYLLKTELSPDMIRGVLSKVEERRGERHTRITDLQNVRNSFLNKLLTEDTSNLQITEEELRANQIYIENKPFIVAVFITYKKKLTPLPAEPDFHFANPFFFKKGDHIYYLLSNISSTGKMDISEYMKDLSDGQYGVSMLHRNISEVGTAVYEATADLNRRFYSRAVRPFSKNALTPPDFYLSKINLHLEENRVRSACTDLEEFIEKAAEETVPAENVFEVCSEVLSRLNTVSGSADLYDPAVLFGCRSFEQLRCYVLPQIQSIRDSRPSFTHSIQNALDYIDEHYAEDISLNSVADHVYLHRDHLSRQFKKEVGINFVDYLMNIRLNHAKILLESTNLRVSDIAVQVGISNLSYFSTVFSRKFGMSPNSIRNR